VKTESLEQDFRKIEIELGLERYDFSEPGVSKIHRNITFTQDESSANKRFTRNDLRGRQAPEYKTFFNDLTISLVNKIYRLDFKTYRYEVGQIE
jgi:hypothetical protein